MDDKVEPTTTVDVDDCILVRDIQTCSRRVIIVQNFPTNNLEEAAWCTGWVLKRDWALGTQFTKNLFMERMLNRFGVNSSSEIPVTTVVELDPEKRGQS